MASGGAGLLAVCFDQEDDERGAAVVVLGEREMLSGLAANELESFTADERMAIAICEVRRSSAPAIVGLAAAIVIECAWLALLFLVAARLVLA
jgi:hypothetical protein